MAVERVDHGPLPGEVIDVVGRIAEHGRAGIGQRQRNLFHAVEESVGGRRQPKR